MEARAKKKIETVRLAGERQLKKKKTAACLIKKKRKKPGLVVKNKLSQRKNSHLTW